MHAASSPLSALLLDVRVHPPSTCCYVCADVLEEEEGGTLARKVGEVVTNTLGAVATAIDIPLGEWIAEEQQHTAWNGYAIGICNPDRISGLEKLCPPVVV